MIRRVRILRPGSPFDEPDHRQVAPVDAEASRSCTARSFSSRTIPGAMGSKDDRGEGVPQATARSTWSVSDEKRRLGTAALSSSHSSSVLSPAGTMYTPIDRARRALTYHALAEMPRGADRRTRSTPRRMSSQPEDEGLLVCEPWELEA